MNCLRQSHHTPTPNPFAPTNSIAVYGMRVHLKPNLMTMPKLKHTRINRILSEGGTLPACSIWYRLLLLLI